MLNQELLAAYFADALAPAELAQAELQIAADHASRRALANQQLMDQALCVALGGPEADERVKQSVLAVVRATSIEQLRAQVLAETSGRWSVEASERQSVPALERRGVREWSDFRNWAAATLQRCNAATLLRVHAAKFKRVAVVAALMALGVGSYIYVSARFIVRTEIGQFTAVVGSPTVHHVGQRSTLHAQRSTPICLGDHIETGDADRGEIQFRDGTTLRLHFNTILEIPNPKSESSNRQLATGNRQSAAPRPDARTLQRFNASTLQRPPEINLLRGQVWTKVQKTTNAPQYAVRTPVATAVARGTEFGLKVQKADKSTLGTQNSKLETNLMAVLTVKEGAVDFFNSFGKIQATAMTESTARADARPTEPKRLQTLQAVRLADSGEWAITTSPLTWPEAAEKLALGGGWAGLRVRDFPSGTPPPNVITGASTGEVRIVQVTRPSPADSAGLQTGDVLLAINGQPVTAASQIEKAILIRSNAETTLSLRRRGEERTAALTVTNRASILPGPTLTPALRARLSEATRQFVEDNAGPVTPTFQSANSPVENRRSNNARRISEPGPLRAAAQNNLGVIFESEDAMGPAIRAYGLAAYVDPQVPLYHFNLGLALRKIGSFDRAAEELETALRLAPQSTRAQQRFAEIQSLLGHDAEALALTDAALQADRQSHGLWELKAQLLWKQHRLEEAREAALKAIELEPDCVVAHGYLGGVLQDQQRFDAAEAAYRKALELDPFFAPLYVNLGTVQHDRQQLWSAEQSFRKAIELWPDFALAYRNLGNVLADSREFAQATAALRKAIALDPDDVSAHRSFGNLSLKQRRLDEAEKHFRNALDVSPNDPEWYYGLGDVQRERGQYAEAEQMYRKAIELKSDHANAHTGLGLVFHARGQFDEAEKFYRQAIELDPKESAPYHNLGEIYREVRGQPDKAEELYGKSIQLSPDRAGSYSGLGLVALHRTNLAEAERLLRKARDLDPNSSTMNNNLGEVLRRRGQIDEAAQYYRRALELDPNNLGPYSNLGIIHALRREFDEAEKMFRALLDRAPAKPSTYVNLASVCAEKGKLEEAEKFFRQALAMTPNRPDVGNSFASFLADHKLKLDEALTLSRRAVQAEPRNASNLDTLGWVHFQRGEFADAEATLRKAVSLFGQEAVAADAWLHLGKVYETNGNRESALEAYRKALSLQSEHKEAKAALEQLEKEQRLK